MGKTKGMEIFLYVFQIYLKNLTFSEHLSVVTSENENFNQLDLFIQLTVLKV